MKTTGRVRLGAATIVIPALLFAFGGRFLPGHHGAQAAFAAEKAPRSAAIAHPVAPPAMPLGLPSVETAKAVLDASLPQHHPQWLDVPMGGANIRVFVLFPDLAGKAPVAVITAHNQGLSDWARAVGTEVMNEGYITIVPDLLSGLGPNGGGTDSFANPEAIATAFARIRPSRNSAPHRSSSQLFRRPTRH